MKLIKLLTKILFIMKTKLLISSLIATIAIVVAFNISVALDSSQNFDLKLADVEARAWSEVDYGGEEMRTDVCANDEQRKYCEWSYDLSGSCDIASEQDCNDGGETPPPGKTNGGSTNNQACVAYGHTTFTSNCYTYCLRCDLAIWRCD